MVQHVENVGMKNLALGRDETLIRKAARSHQHSLLTELRPEDRAQARRGNSYAGEGAGPGGGARSDVSDTDSRLFF